jgi:hypothetical protein
MCIEWMQRGFKDSLLTQFLDYYEFFDEIKPWWYDYEPLHISHQSNLYRKDPVHYSMFADAPKDLPYVWCETPNTYHLGTNREVVYI